MSDRVALREIIGRLTDDIATDDEVRQLETVLRADAALVDLPDPPNRFLAHEDSIGLADRCAADAAARTVPSARLAAVHLEALT